MIEQLHSESDQLSYLSQKENLQLMQENLGMHISKELSKKLKGRIQLTKKSQSGLFQLKLEVECKIGQLISSSGGIISSGDTGEPSKIINQSNRILLMTGSVIDKLAL